jgi:hypothetical protein
MKATTLLAGFILAAQITQASTFTIGGFTFDDADSVRTARIVEGPLSLRDFSNKRFGKYSEEFITGIDSHANSFKDFPRQKSIGKLLGRGASDSARHLSFPENTDRMPVPNVHRCTVELTWEDQGVKNLKGDDFVIFESGGWEGFAVSVRKAGSNEFTPYRYQFANSYDGVQMVNAVAFDLEKFGLADGEMITAIRIRNLFNSHARMGPDKVDDASGQGNVVYPGSPNYGQAFLLRSKAEGSEFSVDHLGSDLIFATGLHSIEKAPATAATPAAASTTAAEATPSTTKQ